MCPEYLSVKICGSFSFPEATVLLVSTKNRDLSRPLLTQTHISINYIQLTLNTQYQEISYQSINQSFIQSINQSNKQSYYSVLKEFCSLLLLLFRSRSFSTLSSISKYWIWYSPFKMGAGFMRPTSLKE